MYVFFVSKTFSSLLLQVVPSALGINLVRINILGSAFTPELLMEFITSCSKALT